MNSLPDNETWEQGAPSRLVLLRKKNFLLLFVSSLVSMLGDAFSMVALPWLVIQLTDSAFALGTVMAAAAIPRAVFILVGGALADKFSPRRVILSTKVAYLALVMLLSALVIGESIEMWMVYIFAVLFGAVGAFAFPAQSAILPQLVEPDELQIANSVMGGTAQVCFLIGPALAGALIVWLSGSASDPGSSDLLAIGYVFAIDAVSFFISWVLIMLVRVDARRDERSDQDSSVLDSIKGGFAYLKTDSSLFILMFYIAAVGFLVQGPIQIGLPIMASERFTEGAAAYGMLMSSHSAGALIGIVLAGWLPFPRPTRLGLMVLTLDSIEGFIMISLGFASETMIAMFVLFNMGVIGGFLQIFFMTWIQRRIPQAMLGRIMSVIIFANLGLTPISAALSGWIVEYTGLMVLFVCSGGLFASVALMSMFSSRIRAMGLPPVAR